MNESPDHKPEPEIIELLHRHLLGATEPAEAERLEQEMLRSPRLRAEFLCAARMDAALHDESTHRQLPPVQNVIAFPWRRMLAAAATVVFAAVMWRWMNLAPQTPGPVAAEVATLIDTRDCQWAGGGVIPVDGRLAEGTVHLNSGVALIEFDGGARMALKGPASLELTGPKSARLLRGDVTVRCEDGAEGFSLLTPTSTVIDLGTEFGVAVAADGGTAVEVLDGAVEVAGAANQSPATTRVLSAGESLKLNADGTDRVNAAKPADWVRDYTSQAERDGKSLPPRLFAQDVFSTQGVKSLGEYNGGFGWLGPWVSATQLPSPSFAPLAPIIKRGTEPGESLVLGGRGELRRLLAQPIDPTRRQTLYFGFSFHRTEPARSDITFLRGGLSLMLRSSAAPTSLVAAGLSPQNRWTSFDANGVETSENEASGSGPYYVIVRIDFRPKIGNRVAISAHRSADAIPIQEPSKWDLITRRRMVVTKTPLDMIALRTLHTSGFRIGEIHIGNSWAAVANPGVVVK